ncbi:MAG: hypothetical protein ABIL44_03995 [candidate division WOR-3 bacterium]
MRKTLFLLFLIVIAGFSLPQQDSIISESRKPNLGIYLAEAGSSFFVGNVVGIGVPIFLAATFSLGKGHELAAPSLAYLLLYPPCYSFSSAFSIDVAAKIFKFPGSFWGAVGGGVFGTAIGVSLLYAVDFEIMHPNFLSLTSAIILPPTFSVIGYNLFRKKDISQSNLFLHNRYVSEQSNSAESAFITKPPKVSVKILEIRF